MVVCFDNQIRYQLTRTAPIITGGLQLPTAAITNNQNGGRQFRYKVAIHAIIKHPFLVLKVCIHRNSMYAFTEHFHLSDIS